MFLFFFVFYKRTSYEIAHVYYPTHLRYLPWLFGVTTGYIFHEARNKNVHIPKVCTCSVFSILNLPLQF